MSSAVPSAPSSRSCRCWRRTHWWFFVSRTTTFGAAAYLVGVIVWLASKVSWLRADGTALWFWVLWALTIPFLAMLFRRDRYGREAATLAMLQSATAMFGIGATAELSRENLGALGFCGLFTAVYLAGAQFLPKPNDEQPRPLTQLGMIGVGVVAVLLSFEWIWDFSAVSDSRLAAMPNAFAILVQLGWPVVAMLLVGATLRWRREMQFNYVAALLPVMAGITWVLITCLRTSPAAYSASGKFIGALLFDGYTLALGVFTLIRGLRADRIGEANLGLLIVSALAISRFFDSDLGFTTRGIGFILVGLGFLAGNILMFRRRATV